jgi:hypothetical protein
MTARDALAAGSPDDLRRTRRNCDAAIQAAKHRRRQEDIEATKAQERAGQKAGGRTTGAYQRDAADQRIAEIGARYDALIRAGLKPTQARFQANAEYLPMLNDEHLRKQLKKRRSASTPPDVS